MRWNYTAELGGTLTGFRVYYLHMSYEDVKTIGATEATKESQDSYGQKDGQSEKGGQIVHDYELTGLGEKPTGEPVSVENTIFLQIRTPSMRSGCAPSWTTR